MNIKTADRLLTLRKEHGFSQEELAEKLGISRQAISKWERAEASPDTDNLIELAKLYGISLDDLLQFSEKANAESETDTAEQTSTEEEQKETDNDTPNSDTVHFGSNGIHVETKDGSKVHVGFDGIYVKENNKDEININAKKGDKIHVGQDGIYFADKNGEKIKIDDHERHYSHRRDRMKDTPWRFFPYPIVATIIFFLWGFLLAKKATKFMSGRMESTSPIKTEKK